MAFVKVIQQPSFEEWAKERDPMLKTTDLIANDLEEQIMGNVDTEFEQEEQFKPVSNRLDEISSKIGTYQQDSKYKSIFDYLDVFVNALKESGLDPDDPLFGTILATKKRLQEVNEENEQEDIQDIIDMLDEEASDVEALQRLKDTLLTLSQDGTQSDDDSVDGSDNNFLPPMPQNITKRASLPPPIVDEAEVPSPDFLSLFSASDLSESPQGLPPALPGSAPQASALAQNLASRRRAIEGSDDERDDETDGKASADKDFFGDAEFPTFEEFKDALSKLVVEHETSTGVTWKNKFQKMQNSLKDILEGLKNEGRKSSNQYKAVKKLSDVIRDRILRDILRKGESTEQRNATTLKKAQEAYDMISSTYGKGQTPKASSCKCQTIKGGKLGNLSVNMRELKNKVLKAKDNFNKPVLDMPLSDSLLRVLTRNQLPKDTVIPRLVAEKLKHIYERAGIDYGKSTSVRAKAIKQLAKPRPRTLKPALKKTTKKGKGTVAVKIFKNKKELLDRAKLLVGMKNTGNNSRLITNELSEIRDKLKSMR